MRGQFARDYAYSASIANVLCGVVAAGLTGHAIFLVVFAAGTVGVILAVRWGWDRG